MTPLVASCAAVVVLAVASMAHVGSPDTFFAGKAGPYDVRVSVRLPGVIPGPRAGRRFASSARPSRTISTSASAPGSGTSA